MRLFNSITLSVYHGLESTLSHSALLPIRLIHDAEHGVWHLVTSAIIFEYFMGPSPSIARIPPRPIELRSDEIVDGVIGLIGALGYSAGRLGKLC
jgi:hypothetical protein